MTDLDIVVEEANRLIGAAQLEDIVYFETSVKRNESAVASDDAAGELPVEVKVAQSESLDRLLVRISVEITSPAAIFRVDVGAQFLLAEAIEVSPEVRTAFADNSAMGILMPYLRESLLSLAARLRVPAPLLPLRHSPTSQPKAS